MEAGLRQVVVRLEVARRSGFAPLSAFQLLLGAAVSVVLSFAVLGCGSKASRPPNVLFVLTDDLRWDAVGAYGNPVVRTPNLDRIAREGARFERFYAASPLCNPSRANLLSGLHIGQDGIRSMLLGLRLRAKTPTVATHLARAGYVTGFVGKTHLGGDPKRWGFEEVPLRMRGRQVWDRKSAQRLIIADGASGEEREEWVEGHAPELLAEAAISFVEAHRDDRWLLWLATSAPHAPYVYDPAYGYDVESLEPPPGWGDPSVPFRPGLWRSYYSLVSRVDAAIGQVLARLDELGLAEDTIVIITSDNGLQLGSRRELGKAVWWEESVRLPFIVRWPGHVPASSRVEGLASTVDLLPTLLDLVGRPKPRRLQGQSFLPALLGELPASEDEAAGRGERERVHVRIAMAEGAGQPSWRMVRGARFKWVEVEPDITHLYDLERDPHELENLSGAEEAAEVERELRAALAAFRARVP